MRIAYADPPYLGCCKLYGHEYGDDGRCWDDLATHSLLIERLVDEFPDGWAMSASSVSLPDILSTHRWSSDYFGGGVRIAAWVKPFAVFKPNVNPAYAWEPVIWFGGRHKRERSEPTVRDWLSAPITLEKGLVGAKPEAFCWWLIDLLGLRVDDDLVDLFPGTGVVGRTWEAFQCQRQLFSLSSFPRTTEDPKGHSQR